MRSRGKGRCSWRTSQSNWIIISQVIGVLETSFALSGILRVQLPCVRSKHLSFLFLLFYDSWRKKNRLAAPSTLPLSSPLRTLTWAADTGILESNSAISKGAKNTSTYLYCSFCQASSGMIFAYLLKMCSDINSREKTQNVITNHYYLFLIGSNLRKAANM